MKKITLGYIAVAIVLLSILSVSCSDNSQTKSGNQKDKSLLSRKEQKNQAAIPYVAKDVSKMNGDTGAEKETGFGLYFAKSNQLIINDKYIKSYDSKNHVFELNAEGKKMFGSFIEYNKSVTSPIPSMGGLYGKDFVIKIDGKKIYGGKFWSNLSSATYTGIVMTDVIFAPRSGQLKVNYGYPSPMESGVVSPLDNSEMTEYFRKKGLLKDQTSIGTISKTILKKPNSERTSKKVSFIDFGLEFRYGVNENRF